MGPTSCSGSTAHLSKIARRMSEEFQIEVVPTRPEKDDSLRVLKTSSMWAKQSMCYERGQAQERRNYLLSGLFD